MITFIEDYGADIDGNRGVKQVVYEIESNDYDDIRAQVLDQLNDLAPWDEVPAEMEITLICPVTEDDVQFTITTKDYL